MLLHAARGGGGGNPVINSPPKRVSFQHESKVAESGAAATGEFAGSIKTSRVSFMETAPDAPPNLTSPQSFNDFNDDENNRKQNL